MKKFIIVTLILLCSSFVLNENHANEGKKFLESFFKTLKGKDWKLNEDCLQGKYTEYVEQIKEAMKNSDLNKAFSLLRELIKLETEKCPIKDIENVGIDIKSAMKNGQVVRNIMKHFNIIYTNIEEYFEIKIRSYAQLGRLVGIITKISVYGTSNTSFELYDPLYVELKFLE